VRAAALGLPGGDDVLVRPEHVAISVDGGLPAQVVGSTFRGPGYVLRLALPDGGLIDADLANGPIPPVGSTIHITVSVEHARCFGREGGPGRRPLERPPV